VQGQEREIQMEDEHQEKEALQKLTATGLPRKTSAKT